MRKVVSACLLSLTFTAVQAGELVRDAMIAEVSNTNNDDASFAIRIEGGTGVCSGPSVWIVFPQIRSASDASYNQAFAAALAALAAEKKVRIHNFDDNTCAGANFISVSR